MESYAPKLSSGTPVQPNYHPPWADMSIIGIAGSSGSGKTSVAEAIVSSLGLPWVVILSTDSFYKSLTPEQNAAAHRNDYDLDSPSSIDFDLMVEKLRDLKQGRRSEIPKYSFHEHQRLKDTTPLYSPHVLILEGILALNDPRILEMLDMKIFVEADADVCLSRRIIRDVRDRGRDIEGCIKQWFAFVKPVFHRYVEPQRIISDIIIPRGIENKTAINMVVRHIRQILEEKSKRHLADLKELGVLARSSPLGPNVVVMPQTPQFLGMSTILQDPKTSGEDFIFYFDRMATLLIEKALDLAEYRVSSVTTAPPVSVPYDGLQVSGDVSGIFVLRGGACLEGALQRTLPAAMTGRILIQSVASTSEPELHYLSLPRTVKDHATVLLLDAQMSSGGAALMAVKVLVDHGVDEGRIVFVTWMAGEVGVKRLVSVFKKVRVVVGILELGDHDHDEMEGDDRWVEKRYFGC